MNKTVLIIVGVVVLAGLGWYLWNTGAPTQSPQTEEAMEETSEVVVNLAEQNDSGEYGTATLTEVDGKVHVVLSLTGAPQGVTQPAHIHLASCANIGGVVYPLTFPVNGVSETTLDVTLDGLLEQLPLALNVHKSATEADVYVACGDIVL